MSVTITAEQRNLLYEEILHRLSGIDDVRTAFEKGDYASAQRLGIAFSDDLRLITEGLGWGENATSEKIELKVPPDVLRRSLDRLEGIVSGLDASEERERIELHKNQERNRLLIEICRKVIKRLELPDELGESGSMNKCM